jgi:hypothetical protein
MGETITMSVPAARRQLSNTSGLSPEQINDLESIVSRFQAARPRNQQCVACGSMIWDEHGDGNGGACWACAGCHRGADLTAEDWHAQQATQRAEVELHQAAAAAAAPKPRDVLREAQARRMEASAALAKLERAVPVARAALSEAQDRHDRAVEAAEAANATSAENLAASFFEGTRPTDPARVAAAARGELAASADALVIAKNARTILDSKLKDARSAMGFANDRCDKAENACIVDAWHEEELRKWKESRAALSESTGRLAWMVRSHAIPGSDARARQLVAEADTPPSAWPEAKTAGIEAIEAALASLRADPEARI